MRTGVCVCDCEYVSTYTRAHARARPCDDSNAIAFNGSSRYFLEPARAVLPFAMTLHNLRFMYVRANACGSGWAAAKRRQWAAVHGFVSVPVPVARRVRMVVKATLSDVAGWDIVGKLWVASGVDAVQHPDALRPHDIYSEASRLVCVCVEETRTRKPAEQATTRRTFKKDSATTATLSSTKCGGGSAMTRR